LGRRVREKLFGFGIWRVGEGRNVEGRSKGQETE